MVGRFRIWFRHEQSCNRYVLQMLDSVPDTTDTKYRQACDLLAHLLAARSNWLARLTGSKDPHPDWFPKGMAREDLACWAEEVEAGWREYLGGLDDHEIGRTFQWHASNGNRYEWTVEGVLTQVNGHHWYHRGQIALLVEQLGGSVTDTDYIFWSDHELCGVPGVRQLAPEESVTPSEAR